MIRVIIFLVLTGVLALGSAWIADRPGGVDIVWLGYRITTSVAVLAAALVFVIALSIFLWSVLRGLIGSPGSLSNYLQLRRAAKGQRAIVRGLIAIGEGDIRAAERFAGAARRLAGGEPLALLLGAQAAQLAGDRVAAEQTFGEMVARRDMKLIGLHGLFIEARRRDDMAAARALAEEAVRSAPAAAWAGRAVLEFRCAGGDWFGALDALDNNMASGLIDKDGFRRQRAVLLTALALEIVESDRDRARDHILEAVKLAPDLVPAAALAGRFLTDSNETRKAAKILENAWRAHPHPDLAEAYMNLRPSDAARERLARIQKLAKLAPGSVESAIAVGRAAIDAQAFDVAREALKPLTLAPTQRVAMLMSELEEAESGDVGRARQWMARALHAAPDPAWTADGFVSGAWRPLSPAGRFDAFEWKVPVSAIPGTVIEADEPKTITPPDTPVETIAPAGEIDTKPADQPPLPTANASAPAAAPKAQSVVVDAVIPLVHAPDDPGPDLDDLDEPVAEPKRDGWSRLRSFFS